MKIIGQGGPTNAVFAQLWGNIAAQFASNPKIIFGVCVPYLTFFCTFH